MVQNLNFDKTTKWYMHKPESIPENETRSILWDFDIQVDYLILAWKPDFVLINKKGKKNHRVKIKENKLTDKYFDLARELKPVAYEGGIDTNFSRCARNHSSKQGRRIGTIGN